MPKYELENDSHSEIDPAGDPAVDSDSDASSRYELEGEDTEEVSSEEEGTPEGELEGDEEEIEDAEGEEGEVDELGELIPEMQVTDPGAFEIGGVTLKAGDKLSAQQVSQLKTEMERSYFREADYTRKCQDLAPKVERANEVITNFNAVTEGEFTNPALLFNHVSPAHALRALAAIGLDVDPQLIKEVGYNRSYQNGVPAHVQNQPQPQAPKADSEFRNWQQKQEQKEFTQQLDQEVKAEIADVKNPDVRQELYEAILVKAAMHHDKTIKQIAIEERTKIRNRYAKFFDAKKGKAKTRVARGGGSSRGVTHQGPQTWEEADRSAMGRIKASRS